MRYNRERQKLVKRSSKGEKEKIKIEEQVMNLSSSGREAGKNELNPKPESSTDFSTDAFLDDSFNAAEYLNRNLPPLQVSDLSSSSSSTTESDLAALARVAAETQALVLQLNAQSSRLSTSLTKVTDEIIRSGGRLAYEIEILKGDAAGLTEVLHKDLREPIAKIIPGGLAIKKDGEEDEEKKKRKKDVKISAAEKNEEGREEGRGEVGVVESAKVAGNQPEFISELRTLAFARERIQSVIEVFGKAMEWVLPLSEYSITSSIISISAPEPGNTDQSMEEKGRACSKRIQAEIKSLVDVAEDVQGLKPAYTRVEELRDLGQVWKGTSEEKARTKFVDSLQKVVEDKENALQRRGRQGAIEKQVKDNSAKRSSSQSTRQSTDTKYGFLGNLQRMRDGLYLE